MSHEKAPEGPKAKKPKKGHPWRAWNPGQHKEVNTNHLDFFKVFERGTTSKNRAR